MFSNSGIDTKEQIREAIDIVDLVGSYTPLRRQGQGYVAKCLWHEDSRPSLQVNPERQSFKCWVCDIGGDIFSFIQRVENVDFREALEMLAERAGVSLQGAGHGSQNQPAGAANKKTLFAAVAWAEEQFHQYLLKDPGGKIARTYLSERGISDECIEKNHLGFSPDRWDWLLKKSQQTPFSSEVLERVGLVLPRNQGPGHYDRFRGRVLFSIRDVRARPIAFGGRVLPQFAGETGAKYINSPETPLFSKSAQLYGLDLAREAITKAKDVIVMEGYTDCLMAQQYGIENVVAVLGTALGERHLPLLRRFTDSITLVLDGDEAGQRRTNEILELFVSNQVNLRILTLPQDLDPCDFIQKQGSDAFRQLLTGAVDALEHKLNSVTNGLVIEKETHRASQAVEEVLSTLAKSRRSGVETSSDSLIREQQILARISRMFHLPEEQIRRRLNELRKKANQPRFVPQTEDYIPEMEEGEHEKFTFSSLSFWEQEILELVLLSTEAITQFVEVISSEDIQNSFARRIYNRCVELYHEEEVPDFKRLILETNDETFKVLLVKLDEHVQAKSVSNLEQRIQDVVATYKNRTEKANLQANLQALQQNEMNENQQDEVFDQLFQKLKNRQTGPLSTDG